MVRTKHTVKGEGGSEEGWVIGGRGGGGGEAGAAVKSSRVVSNTAGAFDNSDTRTDEKIDLHLQVLCCAVKSKQQFRIARSNSIQNWYQS